MKVGDFVTMAGNQWDIFQILEMDESKRFAIILDIESIISKQMIKKGESGSYSVEKVLLVENLQTITPERLNRELELIDKNKRRLTLLQNHILAYQVKNWTL